MVKKKDVKVSQHKRSKPSDSAWQGPGKKPGPKTVDVDRHKRSRPSK